MDATRLHKYYRSSGFDLNGLIWRFLVTDNELRSFLRMSPYCGFVTFFVCVLAILVFTYSVASANVVDTNEKVFRALQRETNEKLPRKESVLDIRPAYNCIHKHLRQTDVFQEKARRLLCKERLDLDIVNSRMSCITKLLKPETTEPEKKNGGTSTGEGFEKGSRSCRGMTAAEMPSRDTQRPVQLEAERRSGVSWERKDYDRDDNTSERLASPPAASTKSGGLADSLGSSRCPPFALPTRRSRQQIDQNVHNASRTSFVLYSPYWLRRVRGHTDRRDIFNPRNDCSETT